MKLFYAFFLCTMLSFTCFAQSDFSLEFDGLSDQHVAINPVLPITSFDYTIEGWVKTSFNASLQAIFDGYESATPNSGIYLEIQTNGTLRFLHREPPSNVGGIEIFSTSSVNDGAWHHFAAVKGSDDLLRLYIDGNLEATSAIAVANISVPLDIDLGRNHNDTRYFTGNLDEIRVWILARTQDEIQETLNCPPTNFNPSLVGYWNFEEGSGMTTSDQTFSSNIGMLENGTSWSMDVPTFQCCSTFEKTTLQNCEIVFYGYAPQSCTDLTTAVIGGTPPYSYLWSNGASSPTINVCPASDQVYIATITDAEGCVLMDTFEVKAVNVICGNNNNKVIVCHNSKNTLCISANAVEAHLTNHGDHLGDCGIDPCGDFSTDLNNVFESENFKIHPNPANNLISIETPEFTGKLELQIFNTNGQMVKKYIVTNNHFDLSIVDLEAGVYQVYLSNKGLNSVQKLVVIR